MNSLTFDTFSHDVLSGLEAPYKRLDSKYFYDAIGDELFQKIMHSPEYYLTRCENEILSLQKEQIVAAFIQDLGTSFDIVEMGAGDATKSIHLLRELSHKRVNYTYYPIDISANVISSLGTNLPKELPNLNIQGLNGDYFDMLDQLNGISNKRKVVLFMGANIGNIAMAEVSGFLSKLKSKLNKGDLLLVGFDLKKDPWQILAAYNDSGGLTKAFNLNLLTRINNELGADFNTEAFSHYPTYNPHTGSCKSYLISKCHQAVSFPASGNQIHFRQHEPILMEISQKYSDDEIAVLAEETGFTKRDKFYDANKWFLDSLWRA